VADHLGDDADTDAPDLEILAGGTLLLDGRGRHPQRDGLALPLHADFERLAAAFLDRLHQLFGREHRLTSHRLDRVARPEPRPVGRRVRVDGADLRRELLSGPEVPDLPLLLEDRVTDDAASRRDLGFPALGAPRDAQAKRAPLRAGDRAIDVFP